MTLPSRPAPRARPRRRGARPVPAVVDWPVLDAAARAVRKNAYAPYSGYRVGAALLSDDGRVFVGANVENASYGLTQCAERSAIGAAVSAGATRFVAIAIASPGARPATPCGACRQVLAEFPPAFVVRCIAERGEPITSDVVALLPAAFGPAELAAAERDVERNVGSDVARAPRRAAERKADR